MGLRYKYYIHTIKCILNAYNFHYPIMNKIKVI